MTDKQLLENLLKAAEDYLRQVVHYVAPDGSGSVSYDDYRAKVRFEFIDRLDAVIRATGGKP